MWNRLYKEILKENSKNVYFFLYFLKSSWIWCLSFKNCKYLIIIWGSEHQNSTEWNIILYLSHNKHLSLSLTVRKPIFSLAKNPQYVSPKKILESQCKLVITKAVWMQNLMRYVKMRRWNLKILCSPQPRKQRKG